VLQLGKWLLQGRTALDSLTLGVLSDTESDSDSDRELWDSIQMKNQRTTMTENSRINVNRSVR